MKRVTYTPQEMLALDLIMNQGKASAMCLCRDYIVVSVNGTGYAQHVDDMNKYLGLR